MTTRQAKIRILDEVSVVVSGLDETHHNFLYKKFAVPAPNFFFHPKYKLGQWDGKIRHYKDTGRTYLYLVDEILPQIVKFGYSVNIVDERNTEFVKPELITADIFAHVLHTETGKPIILRDDQVAAVNALIEHGNGVCIAGTGAGKTLSCAALVTAYGKLGIKSLTIVPDQTLIKQTKTEYINCGLNTGEYSGLHKTLNHQHVVSTWQALKNNPGVIKMFQMVIVDEAHGLRGNVLSKIVTDHAGKMPYRFGFTGTLPKEETDKLAVHIAVGPVRYTINAVELIDKGVLADININVIQLIEDLMKPYKQFCAEENIGQPPTYIQFKDGYFADFSAEKSYLHHNTLRIEFIAQLIESKRDMKKGNVLCLVDNIVFGRKLANLIPGAIFVNGKDVKSPVQRQKVYDMFKDNDDLVVIATVNIAGTGLNIRRIFNLFLIDLGKSFIRVIQAIGRGLRKADDKESVIVTDIGSDLKYGKRHLRQRMNYYKEAGYPHKKHKIEYKKVMQDLDL